MRVPVARLFSLGFAVVSAVAAIIAIPPVSTATAGDPGGFFHSLSAPMRALHRKKPPVCHDEVVDRLADEVDWLKAHVDAHGTIVAQHPDVWGQNRLTRHRYEYEEQLRARLGTFQELNNASLRRSDQAYAGLALSMGQAAATPARPGTRPTEATASVTNLISNPVSGSPAEMVIARTPPFAATAEPFASFGLDNANAIGLEPTIHLDHLSRYLNHLHQLRRINEGDDIADSPGYSLNLVRIPVSVTPGQHTQAGHGAEITITANPQLGDALLPTTFRHLVTNDLVDMLAPGLTYAVNTTAVRQALQASDGASPIQARSASDCVSPIKARSVSGGIGRTFDATPCVASDPPAHAGGFYPDGIGTTRDATPYATSDPPRPIKARSVSDCVGVTFDATPCVTSDPPAHAGGFYGERDRDPPRPIQARSVSDGIGTTFDATPCVTSDPPAHAGGFYSDGTDALSNAVVQGMRSRSVSVPTVKMRRARMPLPPEQLVDVIGERQIVILLRSTHEALATDPANSPCITNAAVRGFLAEELHAAHEFLAQERQSAVWAELPTWNLAELIRSRRINELELRRRAFFESLGVDEPTPETLTLEQPSLSDATGGMATTPGTDCMGPCENARPACRICRTTTAVLAWAILVESALLNERLAEDMRESGSAQGLPADMAGGCGGPFYGPHPSPEARAAFNDYVRRRWPIRVFALDPVTQEQNVEEQYAQRREAQMALAMAFASGRASGQALARYTRRLETDLATISLNKTVVGFAHGPDTFGWRFYPRIQPPPTRGNLVTLAETVCGTSSTPRDLASRRLEPGMRECTAIIVMPSFVPFITFDVQTNWFSLTHPKATEQSMRQALRLSRSVTSIQRTAAQQSCRSQNPDREAELARILRRIDQIDRTLPLQTMLTQIPHENTAGGFELFNTGITDLAPELIGWYGAQGVAPAGTTVLFLAGKGFSVHDTSVIAGGRPAKVTLLSRDLLQVEIPPGVQTISPAGDCGCGVGNSLAARRSRAAIRLASAAEPLPAPTGEDVPAGQDMPRGEAKAQSGSQATPPSQATPTARPSLRFSLPPLEAVSPPPAVVAEGACGCGIDCHAREVVDVHLATPYGVSGSLLIPVIRPELMGSDRCMLAVASGSVVRLTATKTKAGTWRVNEFFESVPDAIVIHAPPVFAAPSKAAINFLLRDTTTGATAGTFSIPAPPFDARLQAYVLAGSDLRNFVGDTSRPATDKTLRGAVKPYLDSVATGTTPDGKPAVNRDLMLVASLVTEQKTIPIEGTIAVEVRESNQASDPIDPAP
jgi:hypothetical protein